MDDKEYTTVTPWIENGTIVDFLGENDQANPLKLARTIMFRFVHLLIEPGRSSRTPHADFSISTVWISLMAT